MYIFGCFKTEYNQSNEESNYKISHAKVYFQSHLPSQAAKGHTLRVVAFVAEDGVGLAGASLTIGKEAAVPQWASAIHYTLRRRTLR